MGKCLECGKFFNGRSDKKYCSDECRTSYNDRIYREKRRDIAQINGILRKNYAVLHELFENGKRQVEPQVLLTRGFDFNHFTSIDGRCDENGSIWIGCYSFSYSVNRDGIVILRKNQS